MIADNLARPLVASVRKEGNACGTMQRLCLRAAPAAPSWVCDGTSSPLRKSKRKCNEPFSPQHSHTLARLDCSFGPLGFGPVDYGF
ncbi:hypothetical protein J6590_093284 [Homalodisca vitripennis]|nr:hypothetical protein J6590_093284 [Homalodisca vitripennis]